MDKLNEIITNDGSISLKSEFYNESFHSHLGALKEAQTKFINPALIDRFRGKSLSVLDICFGLGYNSALLFKNIKRQSSLLKWYGLEIDKRPLKHALNSELFRSLWDKEIIDILHSLSLKSLFSDENYSCKLLWGDAREKIFKIPKNINFDLIFLDGFSPQKCPEIWTIEFLSQVIKKLSPEGSILTYSSSAAVRKTFLELKLKIFNIKPNIKTYKSWSDGTLARKNCNNYEFEENPYIENLSMMQKEHLFTKSSIPYRDPKGINKSEDILKTRKEEQTISKLKDTNLWRKKWEITN